MMLVWVLLCVDGVVHVVCCCSPCVVSVVQFLLCVGGAVLVVCDSVIVVYWCCCPCSKFVVQPLLYVGGVVSLCVSGAGLAMCW